ncbi:MAG TPA: CHRD domain-containing protein [Nostocaceae cyanobacterium]|nr:CHRD domain-containing protein [Nostocaceae cyanobacterium]
MRSKYIFTVLICLLAFVCLTVLPLQPKKAFAQSKIPKGEEIGSVYEAFLTPQQEPGEEKDTPKYIPPKFQSTAPSLLRSERKSKGHGTVKFTKDLSKAFVDVHIEGVNIKDINMFHIHCGKPDELGPILVDFALSGDIQQNFADNHFSVVVTNENIEKVVNSPNDPLGVFLSGCLIASDAANAPDKLDKSKKVKTVSGMEQFARRSELYFNLHTKGQTYFGDIRGKISPVKS